jgi:hypothetical protein
MDGRIDEMRARLLILLFAALCLSATPAMAEMTIQQVFDSITIGPNPGVSSVQDPADRLQEGNDAYWSIQGTGTSAATVVIEIAGNAPFNSFGIFDATNAAVSVQVFAGAAAQGAQAAISLTGDGSVSVNFVDTGVDFAGNLLGFYLDTGGANPNRFYSRTSLNADGKDHLYAYRGEGDKIQIPGLLAGIWSADEYALAFEDTLGGGDMDHNDFIALVESVNPVPVPAAVLLGFLGLGAAGLRLRRFAGEPSRG